MVPPGIAALLSAVLSVTVLLQTASGQPYGYSHLSNAEPKIPSDGGDPYVDPMASLFSYPYGYYGSNPYSLEPSQAKVFMATGESCSYMDYRAIVDSHLHGESVVVHLSSGHGTPRKVTTSSFAEIARQTAGDLAAQVELPRGWTVPAATYRAAVLTDAFLRAYVLTQTGTRLSLLDFEKRLGFVRSHVSPESVFVDPTTLCQLSYPRAPPKPDDLYLKIPQPDGSVTITSVRPDGADSSHLQKYRKVTIDDGAEFGVPLDYNDERFNLDDLYQINHASDGSEVRVPLNLNSSYNASKPIYRNVKKPGGDVSPVLIDVLSSTRHPHYSMPTKSQPLTSAYSAPSQGFLKEKEVTGVVSPESTKKENEASKDELKKSPPPLSPDRIEIVPPSLLKEGHEYNADFPLNEGRNVPPGSGYNEKELIGRHQQPVLSTHPDTQGPAGLAGLGAHISKRPHHILPNVEPVSIVSNPTESYGGNTATNIPHPVSAEPSEIHQGIHKPFSSLPVIAKESVKHQPDIHNFSPPHPVSAKDSVEYPPGISKPFNLSPVSDKESVKYKSDIHMPFSPAPASGKESIKYQQDIHKPSVLSSVPEAATQLTGSDYTVNKESQKYAEGTKADLLDGVKESYVHQSSPRSETPQEETCPPNPAEYFEKPRALVQGLTGKLYLVNQPPMVLVDKTVLPDGRLIPLHPEENRPRPAKPTICLVKDSKGNVYLEDIPQGTILATLPDRSELCLCSNKKP